MDVCLLVSHQDHFKEMDGKFRISVDLVQLSLFYAKLLKRQLNIDWVHA